MAQKRRYKMVRIPEEEYEALHRAKRELMRKGLDSLPDEVLEDDEDNGEEEGGFTMGLLAGLGAAALIYLLTRNKEQGR
ncbi:MAG: hypothetical protein ACT4OI_02805 [Methanobacteriota archaeon]